MRSARLRIEGGWRKGKVDLLEGCDDTHSGTLKRPRTSTEFEAEDKKEGGKERNQRMWNVVLGC